MYKESVRKVIVAVFAHPDDEAFGPGGTLAKLSKSNDVYIICTTCGQNGKSLSTANQKLSHVRVQELITSSKILGIRQVYFLGFEDGTLSNNLYGKLAVKIKKKLEELKPDTVITFEPHGVSGHIDHITVSMATTYVVKRLPFVKELLYYCLPDEQSLIPDDYFVYFPRGRKKSEIDKIFDVTDVWDTKVKAMMAHKSQVSDAGRILKQQKNLPKHEHFIKFKK